MKTPANKLKTEIVLFVDFETRSRADIKLVGGAKYCADESTEIIQMAYRFSNWPKGQVTICIIDTEILFRWAIEFFKNSKIPIVAHNWAFEYGITKHCLGVEIGISRFRCTAATARRMGLPGGLDDLSKALNLKNVKQKDKGRYLINKYSKPNKQGGFNEITNEITKDDKKLWAEYGKADVLAMEEIYNLLPKLHLDFFESRIFELDKKLNQAGVLVDLKTIKGINKAFECLITDTEKKAEKLCGREKSKTLTISSSIGFKRWLTNNGCAVPDCNEKTLDQFRRATGHKQIKRALEYRKILAAAAPKKLDALLNYADETGVMRHIFAYGGAHTLRWAGRGPQLHNFPRDVTNDFEKDLQIIKTHPSIDLINGLLRGCIVPPKSHKLIIGDFGAIEARGLFYLSGCEIGLDVYKKGGNIYKELAAKIFKVPANKIEKRSIQYQLGKAGILGLGYGMGVQRFFKHCNSQGVPITLVQAEAVVRIYRGTYPEVPAFWRKCENAFKESIRTNIILQINTAPITFEKKNSKFLSIILPNGRAIWYFKPRLESIQIFSTFARRGEMKIWGGVIVENIVQAYCRDLLAEAMLLCDQSKILKPVFTVHDEIVCTVRNSEASKGLQALQKIMTTSPEWASDLPLEAECKILDRYGK